MNKTAIHKLIAKLEAKREEMIAKDRYTSAAACEMLIGEVKEMLLTERGDIMVAYNKGYGERAKGNHTTAEQYYSSTYHQQ